MSESLELGENPCHKRYGEEKREMKITQGIENIIKEEGSYTVLTIGNFDGLHIGHRLILQKVVEKANKKGGKGIVLTFDPHPIKVLFPDSNLKLISSFEEKVRLIKEVGIDEVIWANFSPEFADQDPLEFVKDILWARIGVKEIIIGQGYTFGKNKKGNVEELRRIGRELNFRVQEVEAVTLNGSVVSSSRIRSLLTEGRISEVTGFLGRKYSIEGIVIEGTKRGATIGFPTANILPPSFLSIPKDGVYAITAVIDSTLANGVAYIGRQPTFGERERNIEVHLFNYTYDRGLYNKRLKVIFVERIRDEMVFKDRESLIRHIKKDIERARDILEQQNSRTIEQ